MLQESIRGRAAAQARSRVGYMAQRFSLYGDLSTIENLHFFSSAYGLKGAHRRERLQWALDEFELGPLAHATSRDLPLGFKQRLALAVALMHEPDVLFLDEPTSGVDPLARRDFWRRINALAENGITVMVTTHFMEEAEYCDRLVIMAQGRLLAEGASEDTSIPADAGDRSVNADDGGMAASPQAILSIGFSTSEDRMFPAQPDGPHPPSDEYTLEQYKFAFANSWYLYGLASGFQKQISARRMKCVEIGS